MSIKIQHLIIISCASLLLAIWPIPDTIALRNILIFFSAVATLPYIIKNIRFFIKKDSWPIFVFLIFFFWILFHLFFLGINYEEQISELQSLWLRCLFLTPLGICSGSILRSLHTNQNNNPTPNFIFFSLALLLGLCGPSLFFFLRYLYEILQTGVFIHRNFFILSFKSKVPLVVYSAILLPICYLVILKSIKENSKNYWLLISVLGLLLSIFANYFSESKNAFLIFFIATIVFLWNLLFFYLKTVIKWNLKSIIPMMAIFVFLIVITKDHLKNHSAWGNLFADIKISAQIDQHQNWKNYQLYPKDIPNNESGSQVNFSTYQRTAWFVAGIQLLKENPYGYGLVNHSFGALAIKKWPDFMKPNGKLKGATHSGWLDLALGVGIPGIVFLIIPLFAAWLRSFKDDGIWLSYARWTIPIMCFTYLISEVAFAHFIELLFFMIAFFLGLTTKKEVDKIV